MMGALNQAAWSVPRRMLSVMPLIAAASVAYGGGWVSETSRSAPDAELCKLLLQRLNRFPERCVPDALETFPGFSSPPWESIDPSQHIDLIAKLKLYTGSLGAYLRSPPTNLDRFRPSAKEFVDQGGALEIWHVHLLSNYGDNGEHPAPRGEDQTVLLMTEKLGAVDPHLDCPGKTTKNWLRRTFIVTPDLKDPDARLGAGIAYALQLHHPVLYHGETLFIGGAMAYQTDNTLSDGATADVFKNFEPTGLQGAVCSFSHKKPKASSAEGRR